MFKVALVYNLKKAKHRDLPYDYYSEFDSAQTVEQVATALRLAGHRVSLVEADARLLDWLRTNSADIVFNIAEGFSGGSREAQVPAILDFLTIPYTGSGVLALSLALDKAKAKLFFREAGLPTPKSQLFRKAGESLDRDLSFPLIVKPNCEGSAKGIHSSNLLREPTRLYAEISRIKELYQQDALVEEFIEGRELTVGILGNTPARVLPILEIDFTNCKKQGESFYSWEVKEYQGIDPAYPDPEFFCPARLAKAQQRQIKEIALKAHQALGCLDVSRIDIRLGNDAVPYVLEVNPLAGLDPEESNLPRMAQAAGMSYPDLINEILNSALKRYGLIDIANRETVKEVGLT